MLEEVSNLYSYFSYVLASNYSSDTFYSPNWAPITKKDRKRLRRQGRARL